MTFFSIKNNGNLAVWATQDFLPVSPYDLASNQ